MDRWKRAHLPWESSKRGGRDLLGEGKMEELLRNRGQSRAELPLSKKKGGPTQVGKGEGKKRVRRGGGRGAVVSKRKKKDGINRQ